MAAVSVTRPVIATLEGKNGNQQFHVPPDGRKQRIVIVGLGMIALGFIEKLFKFDPERRLYDIVVIGEEPYIAYNRVSLSTFVETRKIEDLYINSNDWYDSVKDALHCYVNTTVTAIQPAEKVVKTSTGHTLQYDLLVLATGSDAALPTSTPGHNAHGVFVYRTIDDLQRLIGHASAHKNEVGVTVGGGLLGLEAAKSMMDLNEFSSVKLIDRNRWVLARQLDGDAGALVTEQIQNLGLDVMLRKRVARINVDENNNVRSILFEDGETIDCCCVCFAIGVRPRDELARAAGLECSPNGGLIVNEFMETSHPGIYAIGECASWEHKTFGIIAPGIEMADVLSFNLTKRAAQEPKRFKTPDLSTKLKLLGVEVASFGDFFADRDGPKSPPPKQKSEGGLDSNKRQTPVKALTYRDPFKSVYKKYLFTVDGRHLLGGMMIGDTSDYIKMNQMVKSQKELDVHPSEFILGKKADDSAQELDDDTQVCSCHNVLKCDIAENVKSGRCKSVNDVKRCTKAGTGCGGCMSTVQTIFTNTMKQMGQEVSNHLCSHFPYSRADMYHIVAVKQLKSFEDVMRECGKPPDSLGCELCKPAIASILSSQFNPHIMDPKMHNLQDTNDRFLANIQRNGTFSVVPRVPGGEITPDRLIVIGQVAKKYNLYCKITGAQRIDMFGARKEDLPDIWSALVEAGMESGHAYAKSLRTIKSCVGTSWCRFGLHDSVGMAVRLENRYKSLRSPHKLKGGVSGCVRECAEASSKDFGLIATEKGYNLYVGGNGGTRPRHAELFAKDVPLTNVVPLVDRYLMFYIRTADKLQRTARWIESLPGGMDYLREVIINDKLGICADMERQMEELVGSYFCEWTEALKNPEMLKNFRQFNNTDERVETVEPVVERGQQRPSYWPQQPTTDDFRGHQWTSLSWQPLICANDFQEKTAGTSSVNVKRGDTQLAIFKIRNHYYATQQMCPHKRAFVLSDGLLGDNGSTGNYWVSCPNHKRNFELNGTQAGRCANDEALSIATFPVEERQDGWVYVKLPPVEELDAVLGTERWKVRKEETPSEFTGFDNKYYRGMKGKKAWELRTGAVARKDVDDRGNNIDW